MENQTVNQTNEKQPASGTPLITPGRIGAIANLLDSAATALRVFQTEWDAAAVPKNGNDQEITPAATASEPDNAPDQVVQEPADEPTAEPADDADDATAKKTGEEPDGAPAPTEPETPADQIDFVSQLNKDDKIEDHPELSNFLIAFFEKSFIVWLEKFGWKENKVGNLKKWYSSSGVSTFFMNSFRKGRGQIEKIEEILNAHFKTNLNQALNAGKKSLDEKKLMEKSEPIDPEVAKALAETTNLIDNLILVRVFLAFVEKNIPGRNKGRFCASLGFNSCLYGQIKKDPMPKQASLGIKKARRSALIMDHTLEYIIAEGLKITGESLELETPRADDDKLNDEEQGHWATFLTISEKLWINAESGRNHILFLSFLEITEEAFKRIHQEATFGEAKEVLAKIAPETAVEDVLLGKVVLEDPDEDQGDEPPPDNDEKDGPSGDNEGDPSADDDDVVDKPVKMLEDPEEVDQFIAFIDEQLNASSMLADEWLKDKEFAPDDWKTLQKDKFLEMKKIEKVVECIGILQETDLSLEDVLEAGKKILEERASGADDEKEPDWSDDDELDSDQLEALIKFLEFHKEHTEDLNKKVKPAVIEKICSGNYPITFGRAKAVLEKINPAMNLEEVLKFKTADKNPKNPDPSPKISPFDPDSEEFLIEEHQVLFTAYVEYCESNWEPDENTPNATFWAVHSLNKATFLQAKNKTTYKKAGEIVSRLEGIDLKQAFEEGLAVLESQKGN